LRTGTGYRSDALQRLDAFAMNLWPSNGYERTVYEVKVSRGDWLREKKDFLKARTAILWGNLFYYVAPMGIIAPEELPREAGLIEVDGHERLHYTVPAPFRDVAHPNVMLMAAVCRRVHDLENKEIEARTLQHLEGRELLGFGVPIGTLIEEVALAELEKPHMASWEITQLFAEPKVKRLLDVIGGRLFERLKVVFTPTADKKSGWSATLRVEQRGPGELAKTAKMPGIPEVSLD
jgi:hypothetical protein